MDAVLVAVAIAAVLFWMAFVPRVFRFDDKGIDLGFYFRARHRIGWGELTAWRRSGMFLRLEFGRRRFAIFTGVYPGRLMDQLGRVLQGTRPAG